MRVFWSIPPLIFILFGVIAALNNGISPLIFLSNLTLLCILFYINTYIHEYGHVIAAKLVGVRVAGVIIGNGKRAPYGKIVFGIPLLITTSFVGGFTLTGYIANNYPKLRSAFIFLGGVLLQLILTSACFALFGIKDFSYLFAGGISISTMFIVANALEIVLNLFPGHVDSFGVKVPNDGLTLLKLPFLKTKELTESDRQRYEDLEERIKTATIELINQRKTKASTPTRNNAD